MPTPIYPSWNDKEYDLLKKMTENTALIADYEIGDVASVAGTANQVLVNGGTAPGTGNITLSIATNPTLNGNLTTTGRAIISSGATTSAATDLLINPTTKASGNLIDAQINSSSKFSVTSAGAGTFGGGLTVSGGGNFGAALRVAPSSGTAYGRLLGDPFRADVFQLGSNWTGGAQDDATKPSWYWFFDSRVAGDATTLFRVPAGGSSAAAMTISATATTFAGNLTVSGAGQSSLSSSSALFAVGTSTPTSTNTVGVPQIVAESDLYSSVGSIAHNTTDGNYGFFLAGKSRGTKASPLIVANGDRVGGYGFIAYDGAAYRTSAEIVGVIDGTPGAGDLPTRLSFRVAADGSASASEQMRLTSGGNLLIGTTTDGGQKLQVAGTATVSGNTTLTSTTASTSTTTGALVVSGGVGVAGAGCFGSGLQLNNATYSTTSEYNFYTNSTSLNGNRVGLIENLGSNASRMSVFRQDNTNSRVSFEINGSSAGSIYCSSGTTLTLAGRGASGLVLTNYDGTAGSNTNVVSVQPTGNMVVQDGTAYTFLRVTGTYAPTANAGDMRVVNATPTFNQTGTNTSNYIVYHADVTETAVLGTNNRLIDLKVGGTSKFAVTSGGATTLAGTLTTAAPTSGTAKAWKLGEAATVSPTSPNRTIRVEIDGTVYYIAAKTTND